MTDTRSSTLAVWVQPGASRERIVGMMGDALKVAVSAAPEKGKANKAVEKLLAKKLGLSNSAVRVCAGETSRKKTVRFDDITTDDLNKRIVDCLDKT